MRNILINGNMNISQRGTSFNPVSHNTYTLDRYKFLSPANGVVTQTSGGPIGSGFYMVVKNGSANNQTAVVQIVEKQNAIALIGSVASLSFQAKAGATPISNLRAALLVWTGTADDTGSATIISTWGANGTNPTWGTNFVMLNVPSNLALSGAWQTFKIENIAIPSNTNNLAVVIWTDDGTQASGAEWNLAQVQLEASSNATDFEFRNMGTELVSCQRYYFKTDPSYFSTAVGGTSTTVGVSCRFPVEMRTTPTGAYGGNMAIGDVSSASYTQTTTSGSDTGTLSPKGMTLANWANFPASVTPNRPYIVIASSSYMAFSAEL